MADDKRKHARAIVRGLKREYPEVHCALRHESAFQLLVATILSAQCTDERVNMVTPNLFAEYPDAEALARARQPAVEKLVKSTGFFRNKATNLREMAKAVVENHGGEIPDDLDSLVALPGVGRKTANVVLGTWFGIPTGVVVDTHVTRLSNLMGLVATQNAVIVERKLIELLPKTEWIDFSHRMIHHGRAVCIARRPKCSACTLLKHCDRVGLPPLEGEPV